MAAARLSSSTSAAAAALLLLLTLTLATINAAKTHDDIHTNLADSEHTHRKIRSVLPSGESCLYIYSVPKQQVRCQPTHETERAMEDIWLNLNNHTDYLNLLDKRISQTSGGEDSVKALKDLKEKLDENVGEVTLVKLGQAEQEDYSKRLQEKVNALTAKLQELEEKDRGEVTRLVSLQTDLLQVALSQQNRSLHENYVALVEQTKQDLEAKIQRMDLDTQDAIRIISETVESETSQVRLDQENKLDTVETKLKETLNTVQDDIMAGERERGSIRDDLDKKEENLVTMSESIDNLRGKQRDQDTEILNHKEKTESLADKLEEQTISVLTLSGQVTELQSAMSEVNGGCQGHQEVISKLEHEVESEKKKSQLLARKVEEMYLMLTNNGQIIPKEPRLTDCTDALKHYQPISGVYTISPDTAFKPFEAYCHMDSAGGWTVISRRQGGFVDFYRGWAEYKAGFGHPNGEHWLGLDKIHYLTYRKKYKLRVELTDWDDDFYYAEYSSFYIADEKKKYKLHVGYYMGSAGDSLRLHHNQPFSTKDLANDQNEGICPELCHGAWWYRDCFHSNLNGRFYQTGNYSTESGWGDGVVWRHLKGTNFYSVKTAIMKIRPAS